MHAIQNTVAPSGPHTAASPSMANDLTRSFAAARASRWEATHVGADPAAAR